ncbi:MAG: MFS transporter [Halobacteriales archaeon]
MDSKRRRVLVVIATAELLAMSLWFSATAAAPELAAEWGLTAAESACLTIAVQLGFVAGALLSSALTLSDAIPPRYLFAGSAVAGAACTAVIAAAVDAAVPAIALRFLTGVTLAGVYPPGMKLLAGWFRRGRGFAIGVLVGALTVGSVLPHLLRAVGGVGSPRVVLYGAAALATVGGLLALLVDPGPHQAPTAPFDPGAIVRMVRDRGTMLANGGYFGHMWELYAVWTWIPAYLVASLAANGGGESSGTASLPAFGATCRDRAAVWADNLDTYCFRRDTPYGDHYVTAAEPEHGRPAPDRRPDAAAFMAYWPWNALDADDPGLVSTVELAADPVWRADETPCVGRYPEDTYTPSGRVEDGGWPLCEGYADVVRWQSGVDTDAVEEYVTDHAGEWTTSAGLLPERVDGDGTVSWNSNLQWSQAVYVLLVESRRRGEPYGLAPGA